MTKPAYLARKIQVNGIELNVLLAGPENGSAVLLLHGFPDDHTVWRNQIPALAAAGYRVIAPDTRGCGESQLLPCESDYKIEHLVADQIALLDTLGLTQVKLVGHDWGAVQGWQLVFRHPERFESFMAMSVGHPWCYRRAGLRQKVRSWYLHFFQLGSLAERFFSLGNWTVFCLLLRYSALRPAIRARYSRPGRFLAGQSYYIANVGSLMTCGPTPAQVPVMGVFSSRDIALVEKQMTDSAPLCPKGWRYARLKGVNHWMQLHAPEKVTALMLEFLAWQPHLESAGRAADEKNEPDLLMQH